MIKPEQPRIEIDDLAAVIRESIAAQQHHDGPRVVDSSFASGSTAPSPAPELKLQPDFQPRSNNRYHISDLLRYHDRAFVDNSYRAILKRPPDATEFARDLKRLRSGEFNKIDLLATLRYSNEGKAKGVELDGLTVPALVRQLGQLPVIGYFVRLAIALVRLPNQVRDQREFAGYVLSQNQQIADFINVVSTRLAESSQAQSVLLRQLEETFERQLAEHAAETQKIEPRIENRIENRIELAEKRIDERTEGRIEKRAAEERELIQSHLESHLEKIRVQIGLLNARVHGADSKRLERSDLDTLYAALEDRFRGTREEIKDRFKIYLPYVEALPDPVVIDLGCGRGEWLEILKAAGINARGVERNRVAIEQCRELGLDVVEDDLIGHLRGLADASASAITGFHVIEHVSIDALVTLLDEVLRVLRPGGVAIFETPNPENVLVGSNFFYLDPTHKHPLPSELMQFLFDNRGFDTVEVLNLHPWDSGRVAGEGQLAERFNGFFFGPMDYAVLGWKPVTTKGTS
jgi:O-antigen chain-terminating methyltransferase